MRLVIRREVLTELSRADLAAVAGGTRTVDCLEDTTIVAVGTLELGGCFVLSLDCYSWQTEPC